MPHQPPGHCSWAIRRYSKLSPVQRETVTRLLPVDGFRTESLGQSGYWNSNSYRLVFQLSRGTSIEKCSKVLSDKHQGYITFIPWIQLVGRTIYVHAKVHADTGQQALCRA